MAGGKNPNVIFILSDDQGVWANGCYGNEEIITPNIDSLAETGVKFENFFAVSPVCSPSRATFLTGKTCSQHGVHDWLLGGQVKPDAVEYLKDETGYSEVAAENGYLCGMSGKWHLGDSQKPQKGYSHWFVHQFGGGPYYNAPMVKDEKLVNMPGYVSDVITDDAIEFIEKSKDKAFLLNVHYTAPHSPWVNNHPPEIVALYNECAFNSCPQEPIHPWAIGGDQGPRVFVDEKGIKSPFHGLVAREQLKGYFAAVTAMDNNIGRILKKLEELGLRENTLVIYASDNGYSCGHHGFWGKGNGTTPRNMYENSIKIPFIMSHPKELPKGEVVNAMAANYDFMPTLIDYLGLKMPAGNYPGRSFMPAIEGKSDSHNEFVVIYDEYGPTRMIRTQEWKYIHRYPDKNSRFMDIYNAPRCVHNDPEGPNELYNLKEDPCERNNLIDDPSQKERIGQLRAEMERWFEKYVVPEKDGIAHPGVSIGQNKKVG